MFVSVPTLLGRAVRGHTAILFCTVSTTDIAESAVLAAAGHSLVLVLDATCWKGGLAEQGYLAWLHWLAEHAPTQVGIAVECEVTSPDIGDLLTVFPGVSLILRTHGSLQLTAASLQVLHRHYRTVPLLADLTAPATPDQVREFVRQTGVSALRIPLPHDHSGVLGSSPAYVRQLVRAAQVPLITAEATYKPSILQRCLKAGISGVMLSEALNEAYTAGIRTGLRNRSSTNPHRYTAPAKQAVHDRVSTFLKHLPI